MDKSHLLVTCIILSYVTLKFVLSKKHVCLKEPPCICRSTNGTTIQCRHVHNISDVIELLKSHSPVHKIQLQGNFTTIPSKAFDNVSVSILKLASPLQQNIPNDSLLGLQNLRVIVFNKTQYRAIPEAFSNQDYIAIFESSHGKLKTIETELQNMSSAVEVQLNNNQIGSISPEAFYGTNNVHQLDLSYNRLIYLHPETLKPLTFLEEIYLQHNYLQILDGCFDALNPRSIDLYGNNLTNIDNVLHHGMWSLRYLNIGGNPQLEISSHSFNSSLKKLYSLHSSNNGYTKLDSHLLSHLSNLNELYLNGNEITYIPRYFFEENPNLHVLQLSNNCLTSIEEAMANRKKWYNNIRITLDGNNFKEIALGGKSLKILALNISRNQINHIKEKNMVPLQNVENLDLSHNSITSLDSKSFRNFHSLWFLDLSHNRLKHLNHSLQDLPKMNRLYLNSITLKQLSADDFRGTKRLKRIYLQNNSLQTVSGAFKYFEILGYLDLAKNNLTTLTIESFSPFWNNTMRINHLWMADNPWTCDCRLAWMAAWVGKSNPRLMDEPVCASPNHLRNRTLRSLNLADYERWLDGCPSVCDCICRWDGDQIYTVTLCVQRGLNEMPKAFPTNVRTIDLSWNNLKFFDSKQVLGIEKLKELNMEHNNIYEIQLSGLPPKMASLRLAYNRLRTFPVDQWNAMNESITQISLSHNPWVCNCDTWIFRNWIIKENKTVVDADQLRCNNESPFYLRNKLIISLTQTQLCFLSSYVIIATICPALLLIFGLLIFCYRHSLIALFYTWGCTCLKSMGTQECPYDVFLMYCENDEQLALEELANTLENSKYSFNLCIPDRDITAPRTQQKMNAFLPQCTKVLVLLTRSFIENRDCMRFLISAMSFSTDSSAKCIIFIIKGELPPPTELDPILRTLLQSCTCLKWGTRLFWQKLIYQLPKKGIKQDWSAVEEEPFLST